MCGGYKPVTQRMCSAQKGYNLEYTKVLKNWDDAENLWIGDSLKESDQAVSSGGLLWTGDRPGGSPLSYSQHTLLHECGLFTFPYI